MKIRTAIIISLISWLEEVLEVILYSKKWSTISDLQLYWNFSNITSTYQKAIISEIVALVKRVWRGVCGLCYGSQEEITFSFLRALLPALEDFLVKCLTTNRLSSAMGKNNSKLKKKNRTQSMAWNFRFPSITSLSMRKTKTLGCNAPHMSISQWLSILNLNQYEHLFKKFKGIEDVIKYNEKDLNDLGVKNETHCFQMASSLVALKTKYERSGRTNVSTCTKDKSQRHSLAVDPAVLMNQTATEFDFLVVKNFNQSKSLNNIKMEGVADDADVDTTQLKKILEWELSLDARDLRSHAWYHGAIPRQRAEEIVGDQDGDFLVRDCTSQPGDYVLSCRSKGQSLHFVINKIVLQPDTVYETVQYRFEEDGFDTVPDLITYYVGSGKPITAASGARIQNPRNRVYPLSFYANKYEMQLQNAAPLDVSTDTLCYCSPNGSPPRSHKDQQARMHSKKQRSLSLLPGDTNGMVRVVESRNGNCSFSNSLPRRSFSTKMQPFSSNTTMPRNGRQRGADNGCSPSLECKEYNGVEPPPKPSRLLKTLSVQDDLIQKELLRKNSFYLPSGSDSGNGSGDSVQSCNNGEDCATLQRRASGVVIKNPKYYGLSSAGSLTTLKAFSYDPLVDDMSLSISSMNTELSSVFELSTFHTLLLPASENKPLDVTALQSIHMLLMDSGSRILANHLTRVDLELTIQQQPEMTQYMCGSGIELCVLPHGHQHRLDLIERTECVKLLVAVTILTCATESERAELLNKWIEVAIDTKTALGNLFGFCSIMLGLCTPQVQRLNETWHILRQKYTDSAFNFEAKLRPTLKSMNECTNPLAPNTTIPHLLPIVLLYERTFEDLSGDILPDNDDTSTLSIGQWECSTPDLGLSTLYAHLNSTRQFYTSLPTFRRNAEIVLADSKVDDLLLDIFRTEFHLKFFWGSRGATVLSAERHSKFKQVLNVMSEKCEAADERVTAESGGGYVTSV